MRILLILLLATSSMGCHALRNDRPLLYRNRLAQADAEVPVEYELFEEMDLNVARAMERQSALDREKALRDQQDASKELIASNMPLPDSFATADAGVDLKLDPLQAARDDQTARILNLIERTDDEQLKRILAEKLPGKSDASRSAKQGLTQQERAAAEKIAAAQAQLPSFGARASDDATAIHVTTENGDAGTERNEAKHPRNLDPAAQRGDFADQRRSGVTDGFVKHASASENFTAGKPFSTEDDATHQPAKLKSAGSFEFHATNATAPDTHATRLPEQSPATSIKTVSTKKRSPAEIADTDHWKNELKSTIETLEKSLQESPPDNRDQATQQVYLRLLHLISNNREDANRSIPEMDGAEQQFWQSQMLALTTLLDKSASGDAVDSRQSATAATELAVTNLRRAIQQLSVQADLQINNVALCREVLGYGQYETFNDYSFAVNQDVLIYCELENFVTQPVTNGSDTMHESEFKGSYRILNEQQQLVYHHDYTSVRDGGRRPRRDFYMYFPMTVPKLPPGKYFLVLEVEDLKGNKQGTSLQPIPLAIR